MSVQMILTEYTRLRGNGLDAKTALKELRTQIVALDTPQREELVRKLRVLETGKLPQNGDDSSPVASPPSAKPYTPGQTQTMTVAAVVAPTETPVEVKPQPADESQTVICPQCGKPNRKDDIFCYACGKVLMPERTQFETRKLEGTEDEFRSDEYFGPDSVLVLMIRDTKQAYKVRPQQQQHDVLIGRDAGGAIKPDVDLTAQGADNLGVSRMHLSLSYNGKHNTISAADMGSVNGTYINGQRLHPQEVRVLRHGDELRLGKLVLVVYFYHPKEQAAADEDDDD